jgi:hypothetical protein
MPIISLLLILFGVIVLPVAATIFLIRFLQPDLRDKLATPVLVAGLIIVIFGFITYWPYRGSWDMGSADPLFLFGPGLLGGWVFAVGIILTIMKSRRGS